MINKPRSIENIINSDKIINTEIICDNFFKFQLTNDNNSINDIVDNIFDIHSTLCNKKIINNTVENNIRISQPVNIINTKNIKNLLSCGICKDMCTNIREVDCCNQLFCDMCIISWFDESLSCPLCRKNITTNNLKKNRHLQYIIDEIRIITH